MGRVLLQGTRPTSQFKFGRLLVGEDAFSLADKETAMSLFQVDSSSLSYPPPSVPPDVTQS